MKLSWTGIEAGFVREDVSEEDRAEVAAEVAKLRADAERAASAQEG